VSPPRDGSKGSSSGLAPAQLSPSGTFLAMTFR
jgi:hypothetical protein